MRMSLFIYLLLQTNGLLNRVIRFCNQEIAVHGISWKKKIGWEESRLLFNLLDESRKWAMNGNRSWNFLLSEKIEIIDRVPKFEMQFCQPSRSSREMKIYLSALRIIAPYFLNQPLDSSSKAMYRIQFIEEKKKKKRL